MAKLFVFSLVLAVNLVQIHGHGKLMLPVNRGSAWRVGFNTPINYDDNGNYCGGLAVHIANGGKCGECGDNFKSPRPRANENGGTWGKGVIVKTYKQGQNIKTLTAIDANHAGFYRFALCPLNHPGELETEECFARYPLTLSDGRDRYVVPPYVPGKYSVDVQLPANVTCHQCVIRWEYVAGNNWGKCPDGTGAVGCGQQETFRTCSDVTIV